MPDRFGKFAILLPFTGVVASLLAFGSALAQQDRWHAHFEKRIRPILASRCQGCHGGSAQEAGLRLDSAEAIQRGGDRGPIVDLDKPDNSLLLIMLRRDDGGQMPPDAPLAPAEIADFQAWLEHGMAWPEPSAESSDDPWQHWSYQTVRRPVIPPMDPSRWCNGPIDRFVLAQMQRHDLRPSPQAARATLLRRLSYDLLGLPPTPQQIAGFERDPRPDDVAYAQQVDRMLADPAYGERWARHWLDVARYADTKDYQDSGEHRLPLAWTYRDFVIRALQEDMPYDEFVRLQLAADAMTELPQDSWRWAAMGFLTIGRRFNHNHHDRIDDMIDATMRGFLGLTAACARCHDHKFDPIDAADYYALHGMFANSEELRLDQAPSIEPALWRSAEPEQQQREEFQRELAKRRSALDAKRRELKEKILHELRAFAADYLEYIVQRTPGRRTRDDVKLQTERTMIRDRAAYSSGAVAYWRRYLQSRSSDDPIWGLWLQLISLEPAAFDQAPQLVASFEHANPVVRQALLEAAPKNMAQVAEVIGGLLESTYAKWKRLVESSSQGPPPIGLDDPNWEALRQVLYGPGSPFSLPDHQTKELYNLDEYMEVVKLEGALETLFVEQADQCDVRAMALTDRADRSLPHVFLRGDPLRLGVPIRRQLPEVLSRHVRLGAQAGIRGRALLAETIVDPRNPLTARVLANRLWRWHFGRGLVETPSDFGVRGESPSHPALLDYLACRFIANGWSIKEVQREIVMSQTYRQSSRADELEVAADPDNRWLSRMSRRRLSWEALRDSWHAAAGRLDSIVGGPAEVDPLHRRRALYSLIDRELPAAELRTFDVASPEFSIGRRGETIVPQQALFLLNHPLVVSAAREAAQAVRSDAANHRKKEDDSLLVRLAYRRILVREPLQAELQRATAFLGSQPPLLTKQETEAGETDPMTPLEQLVHALMVCNEFQFVD